MYHNPNDIDTLIEKSKQDIEQYFFLNDGRIVFDGRVFKDQKQLKLYFKTAKQTLSLINKIRAFFRMKKL